MGLEAGIAAAAGLKSSPADFCSSFAIAGQRVISLCIRNSRDGSGIRDKMRFSEDMGRRNVC